jgi:hypothetical protein
MEETGIAITSLSLVWEDEELVLCLFGFPPSETSYLLYNLNSEL